jgi:hypothetical protein
VESVDEIPGPEPVDDGEGHPATTGNGRPGDGGDRAAEPAESYGEVESEVEGGADGERSEGRDPLRFNNWMKRSATGAVMTGIAVGLQQALEVPRKQPAFVIVASDEPEDPDGPIDLRFDPDSPADTVAIIRRPSAEHDPDAPTPPS